MTVAAFWKISAVDNFTATSIEVSVLVGFRGSPGSELAKREAIEGIVEFSDKMEELIISQLHLPLDRSTTSAPENRRVDMINEFLNQLAQLKQEFDDTFSAFKVISTLDVFVMSVVVLVLQCFIFMIILIK